MHASAISSLIVADWPLHYIIQNFKQFFPSSPGISTTHRAHSIDAPGGCRYVQTLSFSTAADHKQLSYRRETALQGALVLAKSGRLELHSMQRGKNLSQWGGSRRVFITRNGSLSCHSFLRIHTGTIAPLPLSASAQGCRNGFLKT